MKKFNIRPDDEIVLFLGTTYSFSGLDTILENFHLLLTRRQKAKLVIVGGGDLDPKISELVHEKKLEDRVLLTGFRPYDEIPGWLSIASVTINSFHINSITRDVVPIKILQYLAAGKPLVCTKMPDVMRLFPENKSGVHYCDITDPPAFIQTIGDLLENTSQREELAKNGLNHIRLHFSIEATIDKLESLLHSVSSK
jgi:glycosyltransferase involved in cell wall biosynthesis